LVSHSERAAHQTGSFHAVKELVTTIKDENHNQKPPMFVWSAPPLIASRAGSFRCKEALVAVDEKDRPAGRVTRNVKLQSRNG
jgi:hypothetical protein